VESEIVATLKKNEKKSYATRSHFCNEGRRDTERYATRNTPKKTIRGAKGHGTDWITE
jgi:hypothetical protein